MTPAMNRAKPCMRLSFEYKNATYHGTRTASIFYVYSTLKIIQVPPATSANGLFQCATKSEFLPCQRSITFDSNPYVSSYYLIRPTAAAQLPGWLLPNAIDSAADASVHIDAILTFRTPFTYLPSAGDRLEGLGYVPSSIIDWMLQHDAHNEHATLLASCLPGGPPLGSLVPNVSAVVTVDTLLPPPTSIVGGGLLPPPTSIIGGALLPLTPGTTDSLGSVIPLATDAIGDMPEAGPVVATPGKDLTVSTAVTVTSAGCFNPEACPTIRVSRAFEANSVSGDFTSNTVKPGVLPTTVAGSKLDDTVGKANKASPPLVTLGDLVFAPHPAGFPIDGTTVSAGSRGFTIAGTAIQLESSGVLQIGTSLVSIATAGDDLQFAAYSVGGQAFTPNGIAFLIAGTTISAGGPGVTISGIPVRLEMAGVLNIGTSVASIANVASRTDHYRLASMGTDIFTPDPTASAVPKSAISGADSIMTISVTPTNLVTSGDQGTGGSTPTLTPKHSVKASDSRSGRHNNPIIKKRLGILITIYVICQIVAL